MSDRQENPKNLDIEDSFSQDETAKAILEEMSLSNLPDTITLGDWLPQVESEIKEAVSENRKSRLKGFAEAHKRLEEYYANSQNPEDRAHLNTQPGEVRTEFSLKIYTTKEGIVKGNLHKGSEGFIMHKPKRDGIPDDQTSVNVHSHPSDTAFSREDKVSQLAEDPDVPRNCMYPVVTPNYIFISFPTNESVRMSQEDLRKFIGVSENRINLAEEIYEEN